jgi:transcriptional regulator with XRE-family HTH domain
MYNFIKTHPKIGGLWVFGGATRRQTPTTDNFRIDTRSITFWEQADGFNRLLQPRHALLNLLLIAFASPTWYINFAYANKGKKVYTMINPLRTGAVISKLRNQRDWTQSQLAEQLNVTHQAVSRWESGVTFPDLAILANIAQVFKVKVDDLLYGETVSSDGSASTRGRSQSSGEVIDRLVAGDVENSARMIQMQPEQIEALIELAPLAQPSFLKGVITHMSELQFDLNQIEDLAPFLDSDTLLMVLDHFSGDKMNKAALEAVAPHLKADDLDRFANQVIDGSLSTDYLEELAPFLRSETLDRIVDQLGQGSLGYEVLEELAPHLSKSALSRLVARYQDGSLEFEQVVELAPYLDKDTVDGLIESRVAAQDEPGAVEELFPFASKEKIGSLLARTLEGSLGEGWLSELAPFLDRRALNELVRQKIAGEKKEE